MFFCFTHEKKALSSLIKVAPIKIAFQNQNYVAKSIINQILNGKTGNLKNPPHKH
jgi:hypothetical protein